MFNYEVTTYAEDNEVVLRTNSIGDALAAIFQCAEDGLHANIVNGYTGEVLAIVNHPDGEDFATDEMALMMAGFIASKDWGEPEPEEDEPDDLFSFLEQMVAEGKAVKLGGLPS